LFEFAKAMGVETILSEPKIEHLQMVDRMANKYGINIAIHNHALPSYYWHPSIVMNAIKNRSPRIGAAADLGHWVRSGINPLEGVKMLEGRIISIHVKDLKQPAAGPVHEVPWGTGTYVTCQVYSMSLKARDLKACLLLNTNITGIIPCQKSKNVPNFFTAPLLGS
jgi:sugar phosphate isomerase/epimerase